MSAQPFEIKLGQGVLDDLGERLGRTRWPDQVAAAGWDYGANLDYMRGLVDYWRQSFDWRKQEQALNQLHHFRAEVEGQLLHFIQEKGRGRTNLPLLLLHGWPGSFLQMTKIIPLLSDPVRYGGRPEDSFDVVAVSLPGYGFSGKPKARGATMAWMADLLFKLMTRVLGYQRFAVRASDIGAGVARELALAHPEQLVGLHLSGSSSWVPQAPEPLTDAERSYVNAVRRIMQQASGYAFQQSSQPQTLAYGLNDSPAGLAAWMVEKFRAWSDCGGEVEKRFTKDELLTNITLYWATETMPSAIRVYYETAHAAPPALVRVSVPTAMAMFPKDIVNAPREWEARFYNVVRWSEMPRGGHFPEWEEPGLLVGDIRRSTATWFLGVGR